MVSDATALKQKALEAVRRERDRMVEVSIFVPSNPELGYQEHKASALLARLLTQAGYSVTKPAAGLETAFMATRKGREGGPHVAILAEYDALPEIDQAGGHNLISGASIGTAIALRSVLDQIAGQVSIIGCPAEQGYPKNAGGKIPLIQSGTFDDVDVVMMVHPSAQWGVWSKSRAREHFRCDFVTDPAGVGATGEVVNPLDAVALSIVNIMANRSRIHPTTVVQYVVSDGGVTPNVVPVKAEMKFYVRTLTLETLDREVEVVQHSIRRAAETVNVQISFQQQAYTYADTIPNLPPGVCVSEEPTGAWGRRCRGACGGGQCLSQRREQGRNRSGQREPRSFPPGPSI